MLVQVDGVLAGNNVGKSRTLLGLILGHCYNQFEKYSISRMVRAKCASLAMQMCVEYNENRWIALRMQMIDGGIRWNGWMDVWATHR
jgi:hypothetical protein